MAILCSLRLGMPRLSPLRSPYAHAGQGTVPSNSLAVGPANRTCASDRKKSMLLQVNTCAGADAAALTRVYTATNCKNAGGHMQRGIAFLFVVLAGICSGQTVRATLVGRVTDPTGAVVPG